MPLTGEVKRGDQLRMGDESSRGDAEDACAASGARCGGASAPTLLRQGPGGGSCPRPLPADENSNRISGSNERACRLSPPMRVQRRVCRRVEARGWGTARVAQRAARAHRARGLPAGLGSAASGRLGRSADPAAGPLLTSRRGDLRSSTRASGWERQARQQSLRRAGAVPRLAVARSGASLCCRETVSSRPTAGRERNAQGLVPPRTAHRR